MNESTTCPVCRRSVQPGNFCGWCGAHLVGDGPHVPLRHHAFAANPSEHMLHPSLTSVLFPHLPQSRSLPYRLALLGLVALLVLLGYLRLTGATVAIAAAAVPLLYLLYLYEVEAYEQEPVYAVGVTAGVGAALGAGWAMLTGRFITQTTLLQATPQGASPGRLLLAAIVLPLVAQVLMVVGALLLRLTRAYDEVLDGFVFGATSALGFVFGLSLINLFPDIQSGPVSDLTGVSSALRGVLHGFLIPLIDAGTTGLIAAALWLHRGPTRRLPQYDWVTSIPTVVLLAVIVQAGLGLVDVLVVTDASAVLVFLGVAVFLLFAVRFALHHMLLAEAVQGEQGPEVLCFHCHRIVPSMPLCPNCGMARRANPKLGSGREGRAVR